MGPLRRLVDFYRVQVELIWTWRRGRRQLVLRAIVSLLVAAFSLAFTAWLLPGLRIDGVYALAAAVVTIGILSAIVRPLLLAVVAPFSLALMLVIALSFQVGAILALVPLVPGIHLAEPFRCGLRRDRLRGHEHVAVVGVQPGRGRLVLLDARPAPARPARREAARRRAGLRVHPDRRPVA